MIKTIKCITMFMGLFLTGFSCSKNDSRYTDKKKESSHESEIVDYSKMPRVDIVSKIDAVVQQAIKEGWSEGEWIKRFGSPRRENAYGDDIKFIQYYETGLFENTANELVTGITIKLRKGKTFDYSYRTTTFGLPDYLK